MFLERRLERLIERLRQSAAISLRLELWNGRAFDLASHPKVKIGVPGPSALRFLVSPDLMKRGQAECLPGARAQRRRKVESLAAHPRLHVPCGVVVGPAGTQAGRSILDEKTQRRSL